MKTPSVFIGHGSPLGAIEHDAFAKSLSTFGDSIKKDINSVLVISAHYLTEETLVGGATQPETIHDFGNFGKELFEQQYPAPGDTVLSERVSRMLNSDIEINRGLDHGAWQVLTHMFPNADIPVVPLSIAYPQPSQFHYRVGELLRPLRDEGVLILGSGNVVHNLRTVHWHSKFGKPEDWAVDLAKAIHEKIEKKDINSLIEYDSISPYARAGIPTPDHYYPLLYTMGATTKDENLHVIHDEILYGTIDMFSFYFGEI